MGRRLWTLEENRYCGVRTTSGDAADGLHACAFATPAPARQKLNDAGNVGLTKLKDMCVFREFSA